MAPGGPGRGTHLEVKAVPCGKQGAAETSEEEEGTGWGRGPLQGRQEEVPD